MGLHAWRINKNHVQIVELFTRHWEKNRLRESILKGCMLVTQKNQRITNYMDDVNNFCQFLYCSF
jgi:hypothetical protein